MLIAGLEVFAIYKGMNGTTLSLSIAGIAGLGGYGVRQVIESVIKKEVKK